MVSEKKLRRPTLSRSEYRFSLPPYFRVSRVSRSVDRDSTTRTRVDYSPDKIRPEFAATSLPRSTFRRRFSVSAITAGRAAGIEDDDHLGDAHAELYGPPSRSASQMRWSRKDVVYTAENMGFSHEPGPRHIMSTRSSRLMSSPSRRDVNIDHRRSRLGSVTRFVDDSNYVKDQTDDRRRRMIVRSSSVPRMDSAAMRSGHPVAVSRPPLVHRRRAHSVARSYSTGVDRSRPWYFGKNYGTISVIQTKDDDGFDMASFVLAPGEQFVPTNVSVSVLPSGKRAITYTRFSQKGTGNEQEANVQLDRIIQRTNRLQVVFHISPLALY